MMATPGYASVSKPDTSLKHFEFLEQAKALLTTTKCTAAQNQNQSLGGIRILSP